MKNLNLKLHTMKKQQTFTCCLTATGIIYIKSKSCIGMFDANTGMGYMTTKGCSFEKLSIGFMYQLTEQQLHDIINTCDLI